MKAVLVLLTRQVSNRIEPKGLAQFCLFRDLDQMSLARVCETTVTQNLSAGTPLFSDPDQAAEVHLVLKGVLKLSHTNEAGSRSVLTYRGPGSLLGYCTAFGARGDGYAAAVVEDAVLSTWSAADFERCLRQYPWFARNALTIVARDADEAFQRVREFVGEHVEQRIARTIQRVSTVFCSDSVGAAPWLPLSRQDIAEMSGATLFTVSRIMTSWEKLGIVQSGRRRFKLLDPTAIAKTASGKLAPASDESEHEPLVDLAKP